MAASHTNGSALLGIGQASAYLGLHPQSIRRAVEDGSLDCYVLPSGHRRFSTRQLRSYLELDDEEVSKGDSSIICVARTLTRNQAKGFDTKTNSSEVDSDLSRQVETLKRIAREKYGEKNPLLYSDVGSGLSYTRPNFEKLTRAHFKTLSC